MMNSNASEIAPLGPVLPAISHFIDFTATSARQLAWGWYADDMRWWTPQFLRNDLVVCEANSGLPSEVSESGIPKVAKVSRSFWVRLFAPSLEVVTTGQLENLSTKTRYMTPWW